MANETGFQVVLNDSFSGSSICNTVRENLAVESSFISRMDRYIAENFFAENDIHTMLIFGGTNDSWIHAPVGVPQYSDWSADALKCVLPAFCYLLDRAKTVVEDIVVIINTNLKAEIVNGMVEACEKMAVQYLRLTEIDKQHSHPTELGMKQIAEQVVEFLHTRQIGTIHNAPLVEGTA